MADYKFKLTTSCWLTFSMVQTAYSKHCTGDIWLPVTEYYMYTSLYLGAQQTKGTFVLCMGNLHTLTKDDFFHIDY